MLKTAISALAACTAALTVRRVGCRRAAPSALAALSSPLRLPSKALQLVAATAEAKGLMRPLQLHVGLRRQASTRTYRHGWGYEEAVLCLASAHTQIRSESNTSYKDYNGPF